MDNLDRPWQIGPLHLPGRLMLAPMAGVSDQAMRLLCGERGCSFAYTEMVSAKGYLMSRKSAALLALHPDEGRVGAQIFGSDPAVMAEAARRIVEKEDGRIALIDLNMGCPAGKIVRNGDGSALTRDLPLAGRIIESVAKAVPVPVTVKTRKGFDQGEDVSRDFARMAEQSGAAALTLHGRTRAEGYSGTADWDAVAAAKQAVDIPVIGNGDVKSRQEAAQRLRETGCDAVMIGRAAMGAPWVFEGAEPDALERWHVIRRHIALEIELRGEAFAVPFLRKIMAAYIPSRPGAAKARARINAAQTAQALTGEMRRIVLEE